MKYDNENISLLAHKYISSHSSDMQEYMSSFTRELFLVCDIIDKEVGKKKNNVVFRLFLKTLANILNKYVDGDY